MRAKLLDEIEKLDTVTQAEIGAFRECVQRGELPVMFIANLGRRYERGAAAMKQIQAIIKEMSRNGG